MNDRNERYPPKYKDPLYTTPPLPVQEPLSDEQIQKIWDAAAGAIPGWSRHIVYARAVIEALREALAQPVQEPTPWRDMVVVSLVREGVNKHKARELADHFATQPLPVQESVSMRMPKVGDKVICLEDESLGEVVSLTAGGSPDIKFDDGSHGTYLLREFAELFGYVASPLPVQPEPVTWDKPSVSFDEWWNGDYEDPANPFEKDSAAYWAWAGWQAAQRPWVELTEQDMPSGEDPMFDHQYFIAGMVYAAKVLKERNT